MPSKVRDVYMLGLLPIFGGQEPLTSEAFGVESRRSTSLIRRLLAGLRIDTEAGVASPGFSVSGRQQLSRSLMRGQGPTRHHRTDYESRHILRNILRLAGSQDTT